MTDNMDFNTAMAAVQKSAAQFASDLSTAFGILAESIGTTVKQMCDSLPYTTGELTKNIYLYTHYPKVYNLANYARKAKTRKKNTRRLEKYWRRYHGDNKIC